MPRAAYAVAYESVSQFSREYSLFFDQPLIRDINTLRDSNVAQANVALPKLSWGYEMSHGSVPVQGSVLDRPAPALKIRFSFHFN